MYLYPSGTANLDIRGSANEVNGAPGNIQGNNNLYVKKFPIGQCACTIQFPQFFQPVTDTKCR